MPCSEEEFVEIMNEIIEESPESDYTTCCGATTSPGASVKSHDICVFRRQRVGGIPGDNLICALVFTRSLHSTRLRLIKIQNMRECFIILFFIRLHIFLTY